MRLARRLRWGVVAANGVGLLATVLQAGVFLRGAAHEPLPSLDPVGFALPEEGGAKQRDLSQVWRELDRALPQPPPEAAPPAPEPSALPPPALVLVALLPDPRDSARSLAIVALPDGEQRLLRVGDRVPGGDEAWEVVRLRLEPWGGGGLGRLTVQSPTRVHTYEAPLGPS